MTKPRRRGIGGALAVAKNSAARSADHPVDRRGNEVQFQAAGPLTGLGLAGSMLGVIVCKWIPMISGKHTVLS